MLRKAMLKTGTSRPLRSASLSAAILVACAMSSAGAWPQRSSFELMLPQGGCRLTIFADGSGSIHYGAAPGSVQIAAGSFDFASTLRHFRQDMVGAPEQASSGTSTPGIVLPGSSRVHPLEDAQRVRALLQQGWTSRLPPEAASSGATFSDADAHAWIRHACGFDL